MDRKLPVAMQALLERTEREFLSALGALGIDRNDLDRVAARVRNRAPAVFRRPAARRAGADRRGIHV